MRIRIRDQLRGRLQGGGRRGGRPRARGFGHCLCPRGVFVRRGELRSDTWPPAPIVLSWHRAILQLYTRTPHIDRNDGRRAGLRLRRPGSSSAWAASGPQVMEGFHGRCPTTHRSHATARGHRESAAKSGGARRLRYEGKPLTRFPCPPNRATGLGKALKLINKPVRERIPVLIAALGAQERRSWPRRSPKGWQPIFFLPEKAQDVWGKGAGHRKGEPRPRPWASLRYSPARPWPSVKTSSR